MCCPPAHWISAGAVGAARGLNDTPKPVSIGAFALVPAEMSATQLTYAVAAAMLLGEDRRGCDDGEPLAGGIGVACSLGEGVLALSHTEGLRSNLTTAALVGVGAAYGLPMSTTQVSTGAIAGASGAQIKRLKGLTLRDFAIAWTRTPLVAGAVAAGVFAVVS